MRLGTWGAAASLPLVALLCAGTASAADLYVPPPAAPSPIYSNTPAYNWTGFYVGASGGYGSSPTSSNTGSTFGGNVNGFFAGGQVGYNYQTYSNLVLGVEADINWSGIGGTVHTGPTVTQGIDWFGTFRGRLGYAMDNIMPYLTGGLAFGGATRTSSIGPVSQSKGVAGWTIGGGIEMGLANNWSVKAEYDYIDFGAVTYNTITATPTVDQNAHIFKIGLNKRF
jgi:outer membrane immunogenic protein